MRKYFLAFFITVFLIILIISAYLRKDTFRKIPSSGTFCPSCNLILIVVDPLRADNLHYSGYEKEISPNIDVFAKKSLVFNKAYSTSSWTLPSAMSLFTGVYPSKHQITNKIKVQEDGTEEIANLKNLSPDLSTLAQILKNNNYQTAGYTGGSAHHRQFGFDKGFDYFMDDRDFSGITDNLEVALSWIKNNRNNKFFLFLQGYDLHGQYVPANGFDYRYVNWQYKGKLNGSAKEQRNLREDAIFLKKMDLTTDDVRFLQSLYDEKISRMDQQIGELIKEVEEAGLMGNTVLVFLSDHGEEIYDHQRLDHGHTLYQELIHIPLIVKIPGTLPAEINAQISSIDLLPTLLDILQINYGNNEYQRFDGVSLYPLEKLKSRIIFTETEYRYAVFLQSLITPDYWKIIRNLETNQFELYDLMKDPGEKSNKAAENSEKLKEMIEMLTNYSVKL